MPSRQAALMCLLFLCAMPLLGACKSTQPTGERRKEHKETLAEFETLDWQRQVETLEATTSSNYSSEDDRILASALSDDDSAVVIAALETIYRLEKDRFVPNAVALLQSNDPVIRWRSLLVVEKMGIDDENLPAVAKLIHDHEWLVREAAFRTLRRFKSERKAKTYFYNVLLKINEKNPQVVGEIYRTLVWYDDDSAWPYMMKRSYHCKSASELVLVMRELAKLKTRDAQVRLKTLTRSQSVIVRTEAAKLLDDYF